MPAQAATAFAALDATVLAAFGEPCTFHPQSGDARPVSAACEAGQAVIETPHGGFDIQYRLEVFVSRDAVTGIDAIEIGDGIRRDTDPVGVLFSYEGEKLEENDSGWKLAFVRTVPYQKGGNNR